MYIIKYTGTRKSYRFTKITVICVITVTMIIHKLLSLSKIWKSQKKFLYLQTENEKVRDMNAVSMNNLWTYLQGLSLTASNRKWLAERLVEPENKEIMSDQEIKDGLAEAFSKLDGLKQGNVKTRSAEELLYEL